ncbi:MAG: hypothetical protein ACKO6N_27190 [Myxococcota bacterium]
MTSRFVRQVADQVTRWAGEPLPPHPSYWVRRVPVLPARFQLPRPLSEPLPREANAVSPTAVSFFLARVDDGLGEHLQLTLWQAPSWRTLESELDLSTLSPEERPSFVLSEHTVFKLWTWTDFPECGEPVDRIWFQAEPRTYNDAELQQVDQLISDFEVLLEELAAPSNAADGTSNDDTSDDTNADEPTEEERTS